MGVEIIIGVVFDCILFLEGLVIGYIIAKNAKEANNGRNN